MDLDEFRARFDLLKTRGYVKSNRAGPTGVGKTLEDELGIQENNLAEPDLGLIELKAHRSNSSSMVTLFTFNHRRLMKPYPVSRNVKYDFVGESYASSYPNLHKYPATMLPQIGIEILKELKVTKGSLLDPYCGSGSSFVAALECGIQEMYGYDLNPLAILISRAKFTKLNLQEVEQQRRWLQQSVYEFAKDEVKATSLEKPHFRNIDYWFSPRVIVNLSVIKSFLDRVPNPDVRQLLLIPFSETVRECSYTRNNEFKLYRIKPEDVTAFNPDVFSIYFEKLENVVAIYAKYYLPLLDKNIKPQLDYDQFRARKAGYDIVLTSPPYGDSKTTVAYGQFSLLSNEWLGIKYARRIDTLLMGGRKTDCLYREGLISDYILAISQKSRQRALEVSAFYRDLEHSIREIAGYIKKGGKAVYIVGNRTVKDIQLPTDQFIAEKFEETGFRHLFTYERRISNKVMPSQNSPTNQAGSTSNTMSQEYIVVCEKL